MQNQIQFQNQNQEQDQYDKEFYLLLLGIFTYIQ